MAAAALLLAMPALRAQVSSYGEKTMGEPNDSPPPVLNKV
jgi:hypothetical protein